MGKKFLAILVSAALCASCSWMKGTSSSEENATSTPQKIVKILETPTLPPKDSELQRLSRYLEQADAVHREAWWVVAADRKPPGKTVFGKVQRGLAQELKQKLNNKGLFSCDRYLVKREILSPSGLPQKGSVFESCRARDAALHLADYDLKTKDQAVVVFRGQNLGEALGLGTAILNKDITCEMKGDEEGRLTDLTCRNFSQDRNATQSLSFSVYEYHRGDKNLLKLRGQVIEALYPVRKFQADVPLEGKIQVVETQTEAPEGLKPKATPSPTPKQANEEEHGDDRSQDSSAQREAGVRSGAREPAPLVVRPTRQKLQADPDNMRRRELEEGISVEEQVQDARDQQGLPAQNPEPAVSPENPGEAPPLQAPPIAPSQR